MSNRKTSLLSAQPSSPAASFAAAADRARRLLADRLKTGPQAVAILEIDGPFSIFASSSPKLGACVNDELKDRLCELADKVIEIGPFRFLTISQVKDVEEARAKSRAAMEAVTSPVQIGAKRVVFAAVVGALLAKPGEDAAAVLRHTAAALNEARRRGRRLLMANEFKGDYADFTSLAEDVSKLDRAIGAGRLRLALQPVFKAGTGQVLHHEALLRVMGEDGQPGSPVRFITAAEALDCSYRLDLAVLDLAAAALASDPALELAVNISAATARDPAHSALWLNHLADLDRYVGRITVELTETAVPDDVGGAISDFATSVRELGSRFSIDDFGSGYTSFRNLLALRPDEVKIDGCFVRDLRTDPRSGAFVRALVGLAKELGISTVAEWVETAEDAATLTALGADALQGRFFGEPRVQTMPELRLTA